MKIKNSVLQIIRKGTENNVQCHVESNGEVTLGILGTVLVAPLKKDLKNLGKLHRRAVKIIKELEHHLPCEARIKHLGLFSFGKKRQRREDVIELYCAWCTESGLGELFLHLLLYKNYLIKLLSQW